MDRKFAYTDDTDKSYGIAGMVLSLNITEAEDALDYITLDNGESETSFGLDSRYTLPVADGATTSRAWHSMVKRYQLLVNLVVSNILCRRYVYRRLGADNQVIGEMYELIAPEGRTFCSLEDDEIKRLYRSIVAETSRIYSSPRVHDIARRYAEALRERRRLSHSEAFELLQSLL